MGTLQDTIDKLDDTQAKINAKKSMCKVLNDKIDSELSVFQSILNKIKSAIATYDKLLKAALNAGFGDEKDFIKSSADAITNFGGSFPKLGNSLFEGMDEIFEDCPFLKLDPMLNDTMGKINKMIDRLTKDLTDMIKGLADYLPEFNVSLGLDILNKALDALHLSDLVKRIKQYFQCLKTTCGLDLNEKIEKFDKTLQDCHLDSNGKFNNRGYCLDVVGMTQKEYQRLSQADSVLQECTDQIAIWGMNTIVKYAASKVDVTSLFDFGDWEDIVEGKVLELAEDFF